MKHTNIEWTNMTWNPVTGCTKISAGCKNCYALAMAKRLQAMGSPRYANGFEVTLHEDLLDAPLSWKKPRMVFVNSMSDLFHENIPDRFILKVFETMSNCPQHQFQVLTKRPERLAKMAIQLPWPENVWMGVTIESDRFRYRSDILQTTPAKIKFLSMEPLLTAVPDISLDRIDWVIVGGESGPRSREMSREWVVDILRQCRSTNTPFFFKQWGGVQKHRNGRELDGIVYNEMPSPISLHSTLTVG